MGASGKRVAPARFAAEEVVRMMMVRVGRLGGHVSHRHVLTSGWFCSLCCARLRACVGVPMVGRSGAERAAMRKGFAMRSSGSRCQPSATEMAAAAQAAAVSAAAATTATAADTATARVSATSRAAGTRAC
jgi:hypothetical protein